MSLPRLLARHADVAGRSCYRRALLRYCCPRDIGVHAAIVQRSRMSDAWQCRTPVEHRRLRGNIYQQHYTNILTVQSVSSVRLFV